MANKLILEFNQSTGNGVSFQSIPSVADIIKVDISFTRLQEIIEYLLAQSKIHEIAIAELISRSNKPEDTAFKDTFAKIEELQRDLKSHDNVHIQLSNTITETQSNFNIIQDHDKDNSNKITQ